MKLVFRIALLLGVSTVLLGWSFWPFSETIRHYTEAELHGLSCSELSRRHEEVIFAYHDASITRYRETGTFEDDQGLPEENVLPFIILMKMVIRDHGIRGVDLTKPFSHSASANAPRMNANFFAEVSAVCARYPEMNDVAAVLQAAANLKLTKVPEHP